jgi:hypothetical protein
VKVYRDVDGEKHLIGRADIPENAGPTYEVRLFGTSSSIVEHFMISAITHLARDGVEPSVERAVLVARGQYPDILPGWQPLVS